MYGTSVYSAGEIGAVPDRPYYVVENEAEIEAMFDDGLSVDAKGQSDLVCGYCETRTRTTRNAAHRWFHSHKCKTDSTLAARNRWITEHEIAWDLGVSLPVGHPFAPVVNGRQAA
jgi:hypothetical protein